MVRSFFDVAVVGEVCRGGVDRVVGRIERSCGAAKCFRRPSVVFLHKSKKLPQTVRMKKIRIVDREGKLRDEKESCFPQHNGNKSIGAGTR